jgi:hypothetical protein
MLDIIKRQIPSVITFALASALQVSGYVSSRVAVTLLIFSFFLFIFGMWKSIWARFSRFPYRVWIERRASVELLPLSRRIYVGQFWADFTSLKNRHFFSVCINLFNQGDTDIIIDGVQGRLDMSVITSFSTPYIDGTLPILIRSRDHNGSVINIICNVEDDKVDKIIDFLSEESGVSIKLSDFYLIAHEPGKISEPINLHNFEGISCRNSKEGSVSVNRNVYLRGTVRL